MSEGPKVKTGLVPDPNNVPVVYSNLFAGGGTVNGVVNLTLCVSRFTPSFDSHPDNDVIIASRLRIDLETAVALRDFLNAQIELMTPSKGKAN